MAETRRTGGALVGGAQAKEELERLQRAGAAYSTPILNEDVDRKDPSRLVVGGAQTDEKTRQKKLRETIPGFRRMTVPFFDCHSISWSSCWPAITLTVPFGTYSNETRRSPISGIAGFLPR